MVFSKDSLVVSIDGGGYSEVGTTKFDPEFGLEISRRYLTDQVKHFEFDYLFRPILIISGCAWACQPNYSDRLFTISSRIPSLKMFLQSHVIMNLEQFGDLLVQFAVLDHWGLNGDGINLFISGLVKSGGADRFTTYTVNNATGVEPIVTRKEYGITGFSNPRDDCMHWTFPESNGDSQYFPSIDFLWDFIYGSSMGRVWQASSGTKLKELEIYQKYVSEYIKKIDRQIVPTLENALFCSVAIQSAVVELSNTNPESDLTSPIRPVGTPITVFTLNARKGTLNRVSSLQLPFSLRKYL